ncbi:MAG: class II aldolase/adducin family protein [Synergistaceae bacterium]|nr:class II aldolase/adducin family protein [Synergistaceae bacterium]
MNETTNNTSDLPGEIELAIWIGKSLFERGKTAGASANMSFLHGGQVYITGTGTCFGALTPNSFSTIDRSGNHLEGPPPSSEMGLHLILYDKKPKVSAIIHTHSFYSVLWSCLTHPNPADVIPPWTPYLKKRLGTIGIIPYAPPGSQELFRLFSERVEKSDGYLLANHGPVVGDKDLMSTFHSLEELEESAHVAWTLKNEKTAVAIQE